MSASAETLIPRQERSWRMGLANMMAKEIAAWWRTRRWWVQCLVALLLLNGSMALNLRGGQRVSSVAQNFLMMSSLCVPLAAVSIAQDSILGERHSGTAAWVLSKPLRRSSFVLAKVAAHGLGLLVAWIVLPGTIAYFQLDAAGGIPLEPLGYAGAMGLDYLNILFYMTLALMLSTLFDGRGPVLGISIVVAWSGPMQFIVEPLEKYAPWLSSILPWRLLMPVGGDDPLASFLAVGLRLPTLTPVIATAIWCVLFVAVALWRFRREEL